MPKQAMENLTKSMFYMLMTSRISTVWRRLSRK